MHKYVFLFYVFMFVSILFYVSLEKFDYTNNKLFFFQINQIYINFILSYVYFSIFYIHTHVKTRTVSKNSINLYQSIRPDKRSINCLSLFNLFSIEINSVSNA